MNRKSPNLSMTGLPRKFPPLFYSYLSIHSCPYTLRGSPGFFCFFASNPEATRRYTLLTFASQVQFLEGIMLGEGRVRERRVPKTREGKRIRGSPGETTGRWQGSRGQSMRSSHYALERVALGKPLTPLCPRPSRVMSCGCWSVRVSAAT